MPHASENARPLTLDQRVVADLSEVYASTRACTGVCLIRLPSSPRAHSGIDNVGEIVGRISRTISRDSTLIVVGEVIDLVHVHAAVSHEAKYQLWIAIKRLDPIENGSGSLPNHHFGAAIYTKYPSSLRHAKTRIGYSYCPSCDRTTKDYGGKKHTYHDYGTLISDVWRDASYDLGGDLRSLYSRFADLFGIEPYTTLHIFDLSSIGLPMISPGAKKPRCGVGEPENLLRIEDTILQGDCIEELHAIPSNSIDFAVADPPYNVGKSYTGYDDDRSIADYFAWCDEWIDELFRVLKPGRTCAVVNIPLWTIRHAVHMEKAGTFQNWIVWDALSFPVRSIMPSHYAILCYSKGPSRSLPGRSRGGPELAAQDPYRSLQPAGELFCQRPACVTRRKKMNVNDGGPLTDLWWGIHRLKHNARRVDHPCQLPPQLLYRLIALFTKPDEIVLDCFNGAGTTTLAAHQMGRRYIGIERSSEYCALAVSRHDEVRDGLDPFRKAERSLKAKNSPVARMPKQSYAVPKKELQLEIRRIAQDLGRIPAREDVVERGRYPISYYDRYFSSWGEACAAARTTGMTDRRRKDLQDS